LNNAFIEMISLRMMIN